MMEEIDKAYKQIENKIKFKFKWRDVLNVTDYVDFS